MTRLAASRRTGFTLVELLVVIGIIALLIGILLPSLSRARHSARSTVNLSNLRQLSTGMEMYRNEAEGRFPTHSSLKSLTTNATPPSPRIRWSDRLYPYLGDTGIFTSPLLDDRALKTEMKPFAHTVRVVGGSLDESRAVYWGGYGYNYQYLGNARVQPGNNGPYVATPSSIRDSSGTIAFADTKGSRNGDDVFDYDEGTYTIDPPLQSLTYGSRGSRSSSADPLQPGNYGYTGGDGTGGTVVVEQRSTPDARNAGATVAAVFVDGHGAFFELPELDDRDGDEQPDNGFWNGLGTPGER